MGALRFFSVAFVDKVWLLAYSSRHDFLQRLSAQGATLIAPCLFYTTCFLTLVNVYQTCNVLYSFCKSLHLRILDVVSLLASFCIGTPSQIGRVEAPYVSFLWERPTPIQFKWKLNIKVFYIGRIIHVDRLYLSCHVFTLVLILQYVTSVCFCLSFGICSVFACYYFL